MKINDSSLKEILIKAKNQSDVVTDLKAQELIEVKDKFYFSYS